MFVECYSQSNTETYFAQRFSFNCRFQANLIDKAKSIKRVIGLNMSTGIARKKRKVLTIRITIRKLIRIRKFNKGKKCF